MIACDLARMVVCVAFLLVGPDTIWLAFPLLAILSIFAAPFDPASSAAIPNLARQRTSRSRTRWAGRCGARCSPSARRSAAWSSTVFGNETAFLVDAVSFLVSAWLLSGIRRPFSEDREIEEHPSTLEATIETLQYAKQDDRVLSLIGVKAGFGLAAGVLVLIPVFAKQVFDAGDIGFGILMAARGVGALVGPFFGHRFAGPGHRRLFPAIGIALAVFGAGYMALGLAPTLWAAAIVIFVAHLGGGSQWVLSTYGLQRLVPDYIRGRVFAVDFALITLSLAVSSLVGRGDRGLRGTAASPRSSLGGVAVAWAAAVVAAHAQGPASARRSIDEPTTGAGRRSSG